MTGIWRIFVDGKPVRYEIDEKLNLTKIVIGDRDMSMEEPDILMVLDALMYGFKGQKISTGQKVEIICDLEK